MPTPEKKPRGKGFKKGHDPRRLQEQKAIAAGTADAETGAKLLVPVEGTGMLAAMRHVLANPGYHDSTAEQVIARDLRKNTREFARQFAELTKLEEQAKLIQGGGGVPKGNTGVEPGATSAPAALDLGTAAARAILDRILATAAKAAEGQT